VRSISAAAVNINGFGIRIANSAGREAVKLKQYFYVIRPLLALQYIVEHQRVPPMSLTELLDGTKIDTTVSDAIQQLLALKEVTAELGLSPRHAVVDVWIVKHLELLNPALIDFRSPAASNFDLVNVFFRGYAART
jgi:predicted nucleotidyltransferase